jgi:hypothetical protein
MVNPKEIVHNSTLLHLLPLLLEHPVLHNMPHASKN